MVTELEYEARNAVADLVGADPRGVVLGPDRAVLLDRLAEAVGNTWILGDEIVVTRLDDVANVTPWVRTAQRRGAAVHAPRSTWRAASCPSGSSTTCWTRPPGWSR